MGYIDETVALLRDLAEISMHSGHFSDFRKERGRLLCLRGWPGG